MNKYRVRLVNGRVVGPFLKEQIGELFTKGHISGAEQCQLFPSGNWTSISGFQELEEIIKTAKDKMNQAPKEETFIINLKELQNIAVEKKVDEEQKQHDLLLEEQVYDENTGVTASIDLDQIEEEETADLGAQEVVNPPAQDFPKEFSFKKEIDVALPEHNADSENEEHQIDENQVEKTIVIRRDMLQQEDNSADVGEKTIVTPATEGYLEELRKQQAAEDELKRKKEEEADKRRQEEEENKVEVDAATRMLSLDELKKNLKTDELLQSEKEIKEKAKKKKLEALEKKREQEQEKGEEEEKEEAPKKKKAMKPIVAIAFIVVLYFLFAEKDNDSKAIVPIPPQYVFPQELAKVDAKKSQEALSQAYVLYRSGNYLKKLAALSLLHQSLANKFNDNPGLGLMLLIYAELLQDSKNPNKDGVTLFKILQLVESKALSDINVAMGMAEFYRYFGKMDAALQALENFKRVDPKGATLSFYGIYLKCLLEKGDMVTAKSLMEQLVAVKKKPINLYEAIIQYYVVNQDYEMALRYIDVAGKQYPETVSFLLQKADLLIRQGQFEKVDAILVLVSALKSENSVYYHARYLEYKGYLYAVKGETEKAAAYFKKSLALKESESLRSQLASLQNSAAGKISDKLIQESKVLDLIRRVNKYEREGSWNLAMTTAVEGADMAPDYLSAQLKLADIQIKRGYLDQAITLLTKLRKNYPNQNYVTYYLILAYIDSYKFSDANNILASVATGNFGESFLYASLLSRLYLNKNALPQAIKWLAESINRNPLVDKNYYLMAETFYKVKKFDRAKEMLGKALVLDPSDIDYKILYSRILYEKNVNLALGYLRRVLTEFPDNPQVLGEIAITYYKSGQIKYFEETLKTLKELPVKSFHVYEYLANAALLNERYEDYVKYSEELLSLEPGRLDVRVKVGEILLDLKRFDDARKHFEIARTRLKTYPKLLYFLSKVELAAGNIEKAIELATQETKENPKIQAGYVLLGNIKANQGDFAEAKKYFEQAQQIDQNSVDALVGMASIKFKQQHIEAALDLYNKAVKLDPNNAFIHKQIGFALRHMGQSALAVESLTTYLKLEPDAKDKQKIQDIINTLK